MGTEFKNSMMALDSKGNGNTTHKGLEPIFGPMEQNTQVISMVPT